ncbi:MAG: N-(5'-phosphoribosyl)anthranilate isomerase [Phycisphaerae bacterium]|nr:MAG: N-(5'-phosphoribosyl)anthranilate isomerase [Phycisphaerae bacterium]
MMRVKICGITNPEDAMLAANAGADAIGLNFVAGPRKITPDIAATIVAAIPPFCTPVALVNVEMNPIGDSLWNAIAQLRIRTVQLYGDDHDHAVTPLLREGFIPILVHRIIPDVFPTDLESRINSLDSAPPLGVVLDTHDPVQLGGTGKTFDWNIVNKAQLNAITPNPPLAILAGGLNPSNVAKAVRIAQPWAVDVSSGVEKSPGRKCAELMNAFVQAAKTPATSS